MTSQRIFLINSICAEKWWIGMRKIGFCSSMEASTHSTSSSPSAYLSLCHTQSLNDHRSCHKPWDFLLFHALTVWVQPDPLTSSYLSFFVPNTGLCARAAIHGRGRDAQWFPSKLGLQMLIFKMRSLAQSKRLWQVWLSSAQGQHH